MKTTNSCRHYPTLDSAGGWLSETETKLPKTGNVNIQLQLKYNNTV